MNTTATHHLVGALNEGGRPLRVYATITLQDMPGVHQSIYHETLPGPVRRVSFTGAVLDSRNTWESCGQISDALWQASDHAKSPWTRSDRAALALLWERWHLNDMRPGCIHQGSGDQEAMLDSPPCPEGYKWGRAWLVEQVPDHVIEVIEGLQALGEVEDIP